jgi:dethiobiotin synthetase
VISLAQRIFITATNTDIGKTYATRLLLKALSEKGLRVGAFKPIETGVNDTPLDGSSLRNTLLPLNSAFETIGLDTVVPVQYPLPAAPFIASGGAPIDWEPIEAALETIEKHCDIVLIEGAGGLLVPVDADTTMLDMARYFDAKLLLVTHARLGCINDTLLNLNLLGQHDIQHLWCVNRREEDEGFDTISKPYYIKHFGECLELEKDIGEITDRLFSL